MRNSLMQKFSDYGNGMRFRIILLKHDLLDDETEVSIIYYLLIDQMNIDVERYYFVIKRL